MNRSPTFGASWRRKRTKQRYGSGIANGKHILVEKPVVTDLAQLDEIKRLSTEKGIKIFPAHNFVYRRAVRKAKELIDADVEYAGSFANQAKAFSDFILKNIPPVSGLDDVGDTLKIIFGAYQSADTDAVIEFRSL